MFTLKPNTNKQSFHCAVSLGTPKDQFVLNYELINGATLLRVPIDDNHYAEGLVDRDLLWWLTANTVNRDYDAFGFTVHDCFIKGDVEHSTSNMPALFRARSLNNNQSLSPLTRYPIGTKVIVNEVVEGTVYGLIVSSMVRYVVAVRIQGTSDSYILVVADSIHVNK